MSTESARLHRIAATLTGTIIAVADRRYDDADTLIATLGNPADLADAVRQAAGLIVDMSRAAGNTSEQTSEIFTQLALRQAEDTQE
jgi:hypothetical protein